MKIVVSLIMLDEEQFIEQAIESLHFADQLVAIDGGSTDDTVALCARTAKRIGVDCHIKEVTWADHFGDQRQVALSLVPTDAEWWLRIDSDEVFPPLFVENIRPILERVDDKWQCARIIQNNLVGDETLYSAARGGWETWPRIFKNIRQGEKSAWHWIGQVHEHCQLMTKTGLKDPEPLNFNLSVTHRGWLSQQRREDREDLYIKMPGSSFQKGSLTERSHIVKELP